MYSLRKTVRDSVLIDRFANPEFEANHGIYLSVRKGIEPLSRRDQARSRLVKLLPCCRSRFRRTSNWVRDSSFASVKYMPINRDFFGLSRRAPRPSRLAKKLSSARIREASIEPTANKKPRHHSSPGRLVSPHFTPYAPVSPIHVGGKKISPLRLSRLRTRHHLPGLFRRWDQRLRKMQAHGQIASRSPTSLATGSGTKNTRQRSPTPTAPRFPSLHPMEPEFRGHRRGCTGPDQPGESARNRGDRRIHPFPHDA